MSLDPLMDHQRQYAHESIYDYSRYDAKRETQFLTAEIAEFAENFVFLSFLSVEQSKVRAGDDQDSISWAP
jgi:hypothetical protein